MIDVLNIFLIEIETKFSKAVFCNIRMLLDGAVLRAKNFPKISSWKQVRTFKSRPGNPIGPNIKTRKSRAHSKVKPRLILKKYESNRSI